jgi:hypothetical protein
MRFIAFVTLLAACAVLSSADQAVNEFVINGEDASIKDFPYMAKVWNLNWPACGGAILTSRSVLTVSIFDHKFDHIFNLHLIFFFRQLIVCFLEFLNLLL